MLLGSTAIVGIVLARTLSVTDFGVFSYALSLTGIGMAIVSAGLSGLALKELMEDREREARTMSALILIREAFAAFAYIILLLVSFTSGSGATREATAVSLLVLFVRAWDAVEFWFQSHLESRKSAAVRMVVVASMLGVRLVAALLGAGLWWFLILYVIESIFSTGGLVLRYLRDPLSGGFMRPQVRAARALLGRSWLLLLSGAANQVNLKADQIIIQPILGSAAVGTYAAAARLSELAYFLPAVFMTATFPALLHVRRAHGGDSTEYRAMLQRSYDQACWAGVLVMVVLFALGPWMISLLYGAKYDAAGAILRIHVLALPFVFMAAVFSKWILAEDLLKASLIRHGLGAALNIALNLILIPSHGIQGAAIATVVSYTFASYVACFVGRSTLPAGIQMSLALVAPLRLVRRSLRSTTQRH